MLILDTTLVHAITNHKHAPIYVVLDSSSERKGATTSLDITTLSSSKKPNNLVSGVTSETDIVSGQGLQKGTSHTSGINHYHELYI